MGMELKQSLKLSQQLVMTPQLQQAIKLLQLSRMELLEQVREEMEQNPLLEQPDETAEGDLSEKAPGEASLEAENLEAPPGPEPPGPEKAPRRSRARTPRPRSTGTPTSTATSSTSRPPPPTRATSPPTTCPPSRRTWSGRRTCIDHLISQLGHAAGSTTPSGGWRSLIIGNLDDDGYLKLDDVEGDPLIRLANEADVSMARGGADAAADPAARSQGLRLARPPGVPAHPGRGAQGARRRRCSGTIIKRHMKLLESQEPPGHRQGPEDHARGGHRGGASCCPSSTPSRAATTRATTRSTSPPTSSSTRWATSTRWCSTTTASRSCGSRAPTATR